MSKRRSRCPVSVPAPKIPPQPKRRSSPAVPAKTRPQVPRLSVLFQNEAKPNCAGQSFSLASLDSSLYTREPISWLQQHAFVSASDRIPHGRPQGSPLRRCFGMSVGATLAVARFFRLLPMPNRKAEPNPHQRLPCKGSWRRSRLRGPRRTHGFRHCPTRAVGDAGPYGRSPEHCRKMENPFLHMPQTYFTREAYFTLRSNISLVPQGTNFTVQQKQPRVFATPYTLP